MSGQICRRKWRIVKDVGGSGEWSEIGDTSV